MFDVKKTCSEEKQTSPPPHSVTLHDYMLPRCLATWQKVFGEPFWQQDWASLACLGTATGTASTTVTTPIGLFYKLV